MYLSGGIVSMTVPEEEFVEIDLREYLQVIWENKELIIGIFILSVLIGGIMSYIVLEPIYKVESQLKTYQPKFTTEFNVSTLSSAEYKEIFLSAEVAEGVIKELDLPLEKYSAQGLVNKMSFTEQGDGELVEVAYETPRPKQGQQIAATWLQLFKDRSLRLMKEEVETSHQQINAQHTEVSNKLNNLEQQYDTFQRNNEIDLLQKKISRRENKIADQEIRLMDIKLRLEQNQAEIKELKQQLEAEPLVYPVEKSIVDDQILAQLKLKAGQLKIEKMNPNYLEVQKKLNQQQVKAANLTVEKEGIKDNLNQLKQELTDLKETRVEQQRKLTELQDELTRVKKQKNKLEDKLEEVETALEVQQEGIKIISRSREPNSPVAPNKKLNLAISAVLGIMLGVFVVFGKEFLATEVK